MTDMNRIGVCCIAVVTVALLGCTPPPATDSPAETSVEADLAAVREVLADTEQRFNSGDLDAFMPVFAPDAIILAPSTPDVVGFEAIRKMYGDAMAQVDMQVHFSTTEVQVFGDLAYERGAYTLQVSDKASGAVTQEIVNRHIHIFKRQPDGSWKTWRLMVNVSG